jgi:hypothetical protein
VRTRGSGARDVCATARSSQQLQGHGRIFFAFKKAPIFRRVQRGDFEAMIAEQQQRRAEEREEKEGGHYAQSTAATGGVEARQAGGGQARSNNYALFEAASC